MRNKFNKLWYDSLSTERELFQKMNDIFIFFNENNQIKKILNLYDSDWIASTPTNSFLTRVTKDEVLPESILYDTYIDIEIPEIFLPYLNIDVLAKTIPETQCVGTLPYIWETYEQDYFEVYGNGSNLIYKGFPHDAYYFYSEDELDDGQFQENYAKKVYRAVIYYSQSGEDYYVDGTLIQTGVDKNGVLKEGNQEYDEWEAMIDPGYISFLNYSKYHNIDNTEVDFTTRLKEVRFVENPSPPPNYFQQITTYDNGGTGFRVTKKWADMDREYHKVTTANKFKKVGENWVFQASGDFTIDTGNSQLITDRAFSLKGYWLFYSQQTRYLFGIRDVSPVITEGVYNKKELINLPKDPYRYWNYILFKRNPGDKPEKVQVPNVISGSKQYVFYKKEKNKYRIFLKGKLILSAKADLINPPPAQKTNGDHRQVPEYNDTYSQQGDSYAITIEQHTLKNRDFWGSANKDMQYKIKIDIINPLYWEVKNRYDI